MWQTFLGFSPCSQAKYAGLSALSKGCNGPHAVQGVPVLVKDSLKFMQTFLGQARLVLPKLLCGLGLAFASKIRVAGSIWVQSLQISVDFPILVARLPAQFMDDACHFRFWRQDEVVVMDQNDVMALGGLLHHPCVEEAPDVKLTDQGVFQGFQFRPTLVQVWVARKDLVNVEVEPPRAEGFDL